MKIKDAVITGASVTFPVKIYPPIDYALCWNDPVLYNSIQHLERGFAEQLTRTSWPIWQMYFLVCSNKISLDFLVAHEILNDLIQFPKKPDQGTDLRLMEINLLIAEISLSPIWKRSFLFCK